MFDKISDMVQRNLEVRWAAADMREDIRREQRREDRRAQREFEKEERRLARIADSGGSGAGAWLKVILFGAGAIVTILLLLIVLVVIVPPPVDRPTTPEVVAKEETAIVPLQTAEPAPPLAPTPTVPVSDADLILSLDMVRLPSPHAPMSVAVVTLTNQGAGTARAQIECSFVTEDGALLSKNAVVLDLEAGASRTEEIAGDTGNQIFRVSCVPSIVEP